MSETLVFRIGSLCLSALLGFILALVILEGRGMTKEAKLKWGFLTALVVGTIGIGLTHLI